MAKTPSNHDPLEKGLVQIGAEWLSVRAGGLNRYTEGLSRALAGEGISQQWLVMGARDLLPSDEVVVRSVACPDAGLLKRWLAMRKGWRDLHPQPSLAASHFALYAFPICRRLGKLPHVVHFHGPWADESDAEGAGGIAVRLKRYIERSVYQTGDRFITLSQAFADILSQRYGIDPAKIRVIPGGVDVDRFDTGITRSEARRQLGWDEHRPTILCVRRLVNRMGLEQLVEAMGQVGKSHPDARLLIAGKGPLTPQLANAITHQGLNDSVKLLGFVPDEDLPVAYRAADFSLVPTQSLEGFGLIIPESLAAGTPALVTPVGGMPEVVRDLDPSLVLPGCQIDDLVTGIDRVLSGEHELPSDEACQAYAQGRFAWPVIARRILEVYREAIDSHG